MFKEGAVSWLGLLSRCSHIPQGVVSNLARQHTPPGGTRPSMSQAADREGVGHRAWSPGGTKVSADRCVRGQGLAQRPGKVTLVNCGHRQVIADQVGSVMLL